MRLKSDLKMDSEDQHWLQLMPLSGVMWRETELWGDIALELRRPDSAARCIHESCSFCRERPKTETARLSPSTPEDVRLTPLPMVSPYAGPLCSRRRRSARSQREYCKRREKAYGAGDISLTRSTVEMQMPAFRVLREDVVRLDEAKHTAAELLQSQNRKREAAKFASRPGTRFGTERGGRRGGRSPASGRSSPHEEPRPWSPSKPASVENDLTTRGRRLIHRQKQKLALDRSVIRADRRAHKAAANVLREMARQALLKEGERIAELVREKDEQMVLTDFDRYDEDGDGLLQLTEIRGVLADAGLLPSSDEEKAGVRRTVVNMVMKVEDGETDEEKELTEALGNPALVQQRQEELARSVGLVKEQLPELLQRIRKRLRVARQKLHFAHFTQCDAQDEGELEVQDILKLLEDLRALPETEEARSDFARWLLSTVKGKEQKPAPSASQAPPAPAPPVPAVPAVGEKQRSHKRASTLTVAKAKRLARSGSKSPSWSEDMDEVVHTPRSVSIDPRAYGEKTEAEKRSGSKELFMEDVALEDLPRMLTEVRFDKFEFEVMVDFLHEAHGRLAASRQLQIAEDFGLSRGLFQEFRKELETMRDLFYSFDDTRSGVLKKVEVWVALSNLGLLPATDQNKMIMLVMINVACDGIQSPLCARFRSSVPRKSARWQGTRGALKALLQSSEFLTLASQCGPLDEGCMDFPGFLQLVQTVRQMQSRSLREELAPLFERMLRRRKKSVNFGCDAVGMPEVSQALEVLQLGPKHREDQTKIFEFLNEVNEFGFKPLTLDFEAFVRFVRQAKEWEATRTRVDDREYGKGLGLKDGMVDEYRVIFDVIDSSGGGDLDLIGVKRACGLLGLKSLTFDELKELFETLDIDKSGTISFLEFLHMTLLVNPGKQRFRAPANGRPFAPFDLRLLGHT
ncbi:unnamed protein product [Effrenium voratum]|uniref:EF-hand domain-containing protein n=1 Tax=Effrenium voratum TaxID=2562239 RepID=A0AA36MRQ2_9DINO|nr:unnamed protein product [Effrenium voratum]